MSGRKSEPRAQIVSDEWLTKLEKIGIKIIIKGAKALEMGIQKTQLLERLQKL